jgi:peptidylprolyl isomerase
MFFKIVNILFLLLISGISIFGGCSKVSQPVVSTNTVQTNINSSIQTSTKSYIIGEEDSRVVKNGDVVKVDYTGTLKDGTMFDTSKGREPLEFTVGTGQMIAGFDSAVVGMKVGQTKTVTIPAAQAYGEHRDDMMLEVPKTQLPPDMTPKVGDHLATIQPNGRQLEVVITAVSDSSVTIDANHFLAGKDLTFEITLVEIKK